MPGGIDGIIDALATSRGRADSSASVVTAASAGDDGTVFEQMRMLTRRLSIVEDDHNRRNKFADIESSKPVAPLPYPALELKEPVDHGPDDPNARERKAQAHDLQHHIQQREKMYANEVELISATDSVAGLNSQELLSGVTGHSSRDASMRDHSFARETRTPSIEAARFTDRLSNVPPAASGGAGSADIGKGGSLLVDSMDSRNNSASSNKILSGISQALQAGGGILGSGKKPAVGAEAAEIVGRKASYSVTYDPPPSTIARPNCEDFLRRVSVVIHQHVLKCEERYKLIVGCKGGQQTGQAAMAAVATAAMQNDSLFHYSKIPMFSEENYVRPKYCYDFTTSPIARLGFQYTIRKLKPYYKTMPKLEDIHMFVKDIFIKGHLTAECSIVCLVYIERLMENAHVPLLTSTWRPIMLCGLLLASKVWQDIGSWNIDFAEIFPMYTLSSINKLERAFCCELKWDLYINTNTYAKYYFALRSITEKKDFRRDYNRMIRLEIPGAAQVADKSGEFRKVAMAKSL